MLRFFLCLWFVFSVFLRNDVVLASAQRESVNEVKSKKCSIEIFSDVDDYGKTFLGEFSDDDFRVTQDTWEQEMNTRCNYSERAIRAQFRTDVILWYNAMFAQPKERRVSDKILKKKHLDQLNGTQNFIKRWILMLAFNPIMYVTKNNASSKSQDDSDYQSWSPFPYPLASALSHGQRMLVMLKNVSNIKMYNLLLSGNQNTRPIIDFGRMFASHGVHEADGKLVEDKLMAGMGASHHGVNVPLGGVGNINPAGDIIGPEGQSYEVNSDVSKGEYQLGHVYIRRDHFRNFDSLLMGVESTAPGRSSPFLTGGKSHDITSGMKDATLNKSSTGGQKWEVLLGSRAPATYGGLSVQINPTRLVRLERLFEIVLSMRIEDQEDLFKELLKCKATEANMFLREHPQLREVFN